MASAEQSLRAASMQAAATFLAGHVPDQARLYGLAEDLYLWTVTGKRPCTCRSDQPTGTYKSGCLRHDPNQQQNPT